MAADALNPSVVQGSTVSSGVPGSAFHPVFVFGWGMHALLGRNGPKYQAQNKTSPKLPQQWASAQLDITIYLKVLPYQVHHVRGAQEKLIE